MQCDRIVESKLFVNLRTKLKAEERVKRRGSNSVQADSVKRISWLSGSGEAGLRERTKKAVGIGRE